MQNQNEDEKNRKIIVTHNHIRAQIFILTEQHVKYVYYRPTFEITVSLRSQIENVNSL